MEWWGIVAAVVVIVVVALALTSWLSRRHRIEDADLQAQAPRDEDKDFLGKFDNGPH
ncbi:hypothetical protein [Agromyces bauzanensis]